MSDAALREILEKYVENPETDIIENEDGTIEAIVSKDGGYTIPMEDIWSGTTIVTADGSWNGTINTPKLDGTGLTAVYWNGTQWVDLTSTSTKSEWNKWYDYSNKNWANARSADGSMWVWIPRYEYKIDTSTKSILVNFLSMEDSITSSYTLHPAFGIDKPSGGWTEELPGFWIAKYAAGFQNGTVGETAKDVKYSNLSYTARNNYTNFLEEEVTLGSTKMSYPVFKANTYAYNLISVGDAYLLSKEVDTATNMYGLNNAVVDSHLQKNSEWGAVAYLTHSQYGLNGNTTNKNEVTVNGKNLEDSIYVNNNSSKGLKAGIYAITSYGNNNTPNDVNASSTKNMTGVFDLNGCVWEYSAAFFKGGTGNLVCHSGMATSATSSSTEYLTLYTANNKKGDATNETSGWNSDCAFPISSSRPVLARGGDCTYNDNTSGIFSFGDSLGIPYYNMGFRVCLTFINSQ